VAVDLEASVGRSGRTGSVWHRVVDTLEQGSGKGPLAHDPDSSRLDDAARAGWLYFVAGLNQEEIAQELNVSRTSAQRLVSRALTERLITFRLNHPIATCMELARRLRERYGLVTCDVVPAAALPIKVGGGLAEHAAAVLEGWLRAPDPRIIALGTGRMMNAVVAKVSPLNAAHHRLVSLVGSISPDGSATPLDAIGLLASVTRARQFPMPLPSYASSLDERKQFLRLEPVKRIRALAEAAKFRFVGVGQVDAEAQLSAAGILSAKDLREARARGAVGEIAGWAFDINGKTIVGGINDRVTSVPPRVPKDGLAVAVAFGPGKVGPLRAAMVGRLVNSVMTDEETARALLDD
jgi:DNA-binding transcriptional regulator LsrR (DeoR family)